MCLICSMLGHWTVLISLEIILSPGSHFLLDLLLPSKPRNFGQVAEPGPASHTRLWWGSNNAGGGNGPNVATCSKSRVAMNSASQLMNISKKGQRRPCLALGFKMLVSPLTSSVILAGCFTSLNLSFLNYKMGLLVAVGQDHCEK